MHLQFVGSGDAFGSGGRFNTCFHVVGAETNFLIDCGASSLPALKRLRIARETASRKSMSAWMRFNVLFLSSWDPLKS